ncbi:MAG: hypothetical protein JOZ39_11875 [Chloroflexi bacterium]|nr:hypothetical protein [Chloroflexota bacterium]
MRRQGSVEALNLIARSVAEAVAAARSEVEPGKTDNFLAGQLMAYGHVIAAIERERDLLQQQLVQEAGLHSPPAEPVWDAELALLSQSGLTSEDVFRLAMDFRQMELPSLEVADETAPEATEGEPSVMAETLPA